MDDERRISEFDRLEGALHGLPDVVLTKPTTIRARMPLIGIAQTYVLQTYRQVGKGDHAFIETIQDGHALRLVLPPEVNDALARQRESLTDKSRSKAAKRVAAERKEAGIVPGFLRPGAKKPVRKRKKKGASDV